MLCGFWVVGGVLSWWSREGNVNWDAYADCLVIHCTNQAGGLVESGRWGARIRATMEGLVWILLGAVVDRLTGELTADWGGLINRGGAREMVGKVMVRQVIEMEERQMMGVGRWSDICGICADQRVLGTWHVIGEMLIKPFDEIPRMFGWDVQMIQEDGRKWVHGRFLPYWWHK